MIKIVVDAMGGDHSPNANVNGVVMALNNIKDLQVILVGNQEQIEPLLKNSNYDKERLTIVDAKDVIDCNDKPTEAIKHKTESSLYKTFEILKKDESVGGMVTVGSTGALLAGAIFKIGRIRGVKRPAFCPLVPTVKNTMVGICDSGANVDCDSFQLNQFATMGSLYLQKAFNVENPRVALLNIGVEEEKGDALRKETYGVLQQNKNINFVGNMESRELLTGNFDLVVCDGFSGNVLLKTTEGSCEQLFKLFKKCFFKNLKNKIATLMLKKDVGQIKKMLDYNNHGGAVLLGTSKTIVKGHGASKDLSISKCIEQAYNMEKNNLRQAISDAISQVE